MKCEICHKAEAAAVLHRKDENGADRELYVCKACAAAAQAPQKGNGKSGPVKITAGDAKEAPPFVQNFFKAALGLVEGIAEKEKDKKACPGCGRTWEQIKEEHRVGCPRCYRAFAELIRNEFLRAAYGRVHTGEMPEGTPAAETRTALARALKLAVRHQQFEKAAEIRRKLDTLKEDPPPEGQS